MFIFSRPGGPQITAFLKEREHDSFSYWEVGATRDSPTANYDIDHNRQMLGHGRDTFERAKAAIRRWSMFDVPGVELIPTDTPIEPGQDVAVLAHHLGFYSLNACRIVYVIDEPDLFGFAYGTLTEHVESGEERFAVELHEDTDEVWYDIFAFSRPAHILVSLGYQFARYRQRRFAAASKAAMIRATAISQAPEAAKAD